MNREKAYRTAIDMVLQNLSVNINGTPVVVPVYDSKLESNSDLYVIYGAQISQRDGTLHCRRWRTTMELEICHRQQESATMDWVDDVSEEIENRVFTTLPDTDTFTAVPGWLIQLTNLETAQTFKMREVQGGSGLIVIKLLQISSLITKI